MPENPNLPFRDPEVVRRLTREAVRLLEPKAAALGRPLRFMEVCGSHTAAISRLGIRSGLGDVLELVAGPGCPVCVTDQGEIDAMIELGRDPGVILTTFGDLIRVPGRGGSLAEERAEGADVRVVYAPSDALEIARENPDKLVVFLGVGFETTAPTVVTAIERAEAAGIKNFAVFSSHKLTPPAVRALLTDPQVRIDGFILPGHVSTIIGRRAWLFLAEQPRPSVIAGFEPLDVLAAVVRLGQLPSGSVENSYPRVVREDGNPVARRLLEQYFELSDAAWRGLGVIPASGLRFRSAYEKWSAEKRLGLEISPREGNPACRCGEVLKGELLPTGCPLFGTACTPDRPVGPCMVSGEGACGIFYRFERTGNYGNRTGAPSPR